MADGDELWELAVTMPPVTESIHKLLVRCGRTVVVVEKDNNGWAPVSGGAVTSRRPDYEGAVADARGWVRAAERKRLLANALDDVLRKHADPEGGPRSCCTPDSLGALGNCSVCGWISPPSGEDGEPRG